MASVAEDVEVAVEVVVVAAVEVVVEVAEEVVVEEGSQNFLETKLLSIKRNHMKVVVD